MITIRKNKDRGHADHGWLKSNHTFSFGDYKDREQMGFRSLRVINDDWVAPGRGFGAHAHRDMEILSYVLAGKLAHKDSMGHTEVLGPNEIQKMSAGSGVIHSEFNGSDTEPVHFLQIWIEPGTRGTPPAYEQIQFDPEEKRNRFRILASSSPVEGAVQINRDAQVAVAELTPKSQLSHSLAPGRAAWLHVIAGEICVNGQPLLEGDSAAVEATDTLEIVSSGTKNAEVLLFDLA
jgi:redox-sensitive bicupin YhaK (pirin superfamily)